MPLCPKNINTFPLASRLIFPTFLWGEMIIRKRHDLFHIRMPTLDSAHLKFSTQCSPLKCGCAYDRTRPLSSACVCHLLSLSVWRLWKGSREPTFFLPPSFTGVCADTAAELRLFTHSNYQRCICQRVHCVASSFAILIVFFSGK